MAEIPWEVENIIYGLMTVTGSVPCRFGISLELKDSGLAASLIADGMGNWDVGRGVPCARLHRQMQI